MSLRTRYEFTLPRGYVDREGAVHRTGVMRLATARDELEPLRDPTISGPDDPRLTVVVLARVVESIGTLELVTTHDIENLFAADLAYLQDFYGVINFGTQDEFDAFVVAQAEMGPAVGVAPARGGPATPELAAQGGASDDVAPASSGGAATSTQVPAASEAAGRPGRSAIEELPTEPR